jgi:hypothetical protein
MRCNIAARPTAPMSLAIAQVRLLNAHFPAPEGIAGAGARNASGVQSPSPGLRGTSYPGLPSQKRPNPESGCIAPVPAISMSRACSPPKLRKPPDLYFTDRQRELSSLREIVVVPAHAPMFPPTPKNLRGNTWNVTAPPEIALAPRTFAVISRCRNCAAWRVLCSIDYRGSIPYPPNPLR